MTVAPTEKEDENGGLPDTTMKEGIREERQQKKAKWMYESMRHWDERPRLLSASGGYATALEKSSS